MHWRGRGSGDEHGRRDWQWVYEHGRRDWQWVLEHTGIPGPCARATRTQGIGKLTEDANVEENSRALHPEAQLELLAVAKRADNKLLPYAVPFALWLAARLLVRGHLEAPRRVCVAAMANTAGQWLALAVAALHE